MSARCFAAAFLTPTATSCAQHGLLELSDASSAGCEAAIGYNNAESGWTGVAAGSGGAVGTESTDHFVRGCYTSAWTPNDGYWLGSYNTGTGCSNSCFFLSVNYFGTYYLCA